MLCLCYINNMVGPECECHREGNAILMFSFNESYFDFISYLYVLSDDVFWLNYVVFKGYVT